MLLGIGLSMNIANAYLVVFFNMVIAYALYFFVLSFNYELPWDKCNTQWSSPSKPSIFHIF